MLVACIGKQPAGDVLCPAPRTTPSGEQSRDLLWLVDKDRGALPGPGASRILAYLVADTAILNRYHIQCRRICRAAIASNRLVERQTDRTLRHNECFCLAGLCAVFRPWIRSLISSLICKPSYWTCHIVMCPLYMTSPHLTTSSTFQLDNPCSPSFAGLHMHSPLPTRRHDRRRFIFRHGVKCNRSRKVEVLSHEDVTASRTVRKVETACRSVLRRAGSAPFVTLHGRWSCPTHLARMRCL